MKKVLIIIAALAVIAIVGWLAFNKFTPKPVVSDFQTTQSETLETDLEQELMTTEDDGGAADFVELQKSAEGL